MNNSTGTCLGENESLSDSMSFLGIIVEIWSSSCLGRRMTRQVGDDDGDDSDATTEEEVTDKGDDVGESEGPTSRVMNLTKDVASCMGSDVSLVETLQSDQNVEIMKDYPPL